MGLELIVTSTPKGLKPNSSGFCTVAATTGMSRQIMMKLEALSGYEFRFGLSSPDASRNPTNYAHSQMTVTGENICALSQVAFCGADYSGRTNKIAHHFVLAANEKAPAGPASMMRQMATGVFKHAWQGDAQELPPADLGSLVTPQAPTTGPAALWQKTAGNAGWAGALAKAYRESKTIPAFVVFHPGTDVLALFEESLAVLPPAERWGVCFATYYTTAPTGCHYHWRAVLAGSTGAKELARFPNATVIDLTKGTLPAPEDNAYTQAAAMGAIVDAVAKAPVEPQPDLGKPADKLSLPSFLGFETKNVHTPTAAAPNTPAKTAAPSAGPSHLADSQWRYRAAYGKAKSIGIALGVLAGILLATNLFTCSRLASEHREKVSAWSDLSSAERNLEQAKRDAARIQGELDSARRRLAQRRPALPRPAPKRPDKPVRPVKPPSTTNTTRPKPTPPRPKPATTQNTVPSVKTPAKPKPTLKPLKLIDFVAPDNPVKPTPIAEEKDDHIAFKVPNFDAILHSPEIKTTQKKKLLWLKHDGKDFAVRFRTQGGDEDNLFLVTRAPQNGLLVWDIQRNVRRKYSAWLDYFVLLAADTASDKMYPCMRPRKPIAHTLTVRYTDDGKFEGPTKSSRCVIDYPWIDALQIQHESVANGKPVTIEHPAGNQLRTIDIRRRFPAYRERGAAKGARAAGPTVGKPKAHWVSVTASELAIQLKFAKSREGRNKTNGAEKLAVSLSFLPGNNRLPPAPHRFFSARASELKKVERELKDWRAKLKDAREAKPPRPKAAKRHKEKVLEFEALVERIRAENAALMEFPADLFRSPDDAATVRALKTPRGGRFKDEDAGKSKLFATLKTTPAEYLKAAGTVTILDPWGVPVATITPKVERAPR